MATGTEEQVEDTTNHISRETVAKDDQEADIATTIKPGLYGWGKFHPQWLQVFNKPTWLLACFCFAVFSSTMAGALMPAVTDTLERRFHLNSVRSGLLNSSYDIAALLIVLFVCHYGERGHKGKWISVGAIVYGVGSCIITLPHFVAEPYRADSLSYHHNGTCPADFPHDICGPTGQLERNTSWSYYILLAGQAVRGFGGTCLGTLMLSYIDENVTQRESPMYLSIISVVGLVAMAIGFLCGGQLLDLYGEFDKIPRDKWPKPWDPDWYGCWWLGYYVGGVSAFLISIPLFGFPRELPSKLKARQQDEKQSHDEDSPSVTGTGFAYNWAEIPRMTLNLLKNPVFTCFTIRTTLEVMFASGWGVFMPKYLQNMYGMNPGFSAMIAGAISLGPLMTGTLVGGWVIKKFNWKVRGVLFFGFITTVAGSFSCLGILFTCPTRPTAGASIDYSGNVLLKDKGSLLDACNANCSCPTNDYVPVCFEEMGITYYSPCFAGCDESVQVGAKIEYNDCACVRHYFSSVANSNYSVIQGECPQTPYCINQRNWFIATWVITCLMYGMSGMPLVQSFLRAVPFNQRTLALGLQSIPLRMLGTVPGPILMGLMFDYSCILWKRYCSENLSCLQYDNETMVSLVLFTGIFFRISSGALLLLAILLYRPPKHRSAQGKTAQGDASAQNDEKTEVYEGSIFDMIIARIRRQIQFNKNASVYAN